MICLVMLTALTFVFLPISKMNKKVSFDLNKLLARFLWLLSPAVSYFILQRFYGSSLTIAELARKYEVPYIIWANYDIEEENRDMSVNYLGAYVLKTAGCSLTGYQKYLLDLMDKVPILTQICYIGEDGAVREPDEKSEYTDLIGEYGRVQYNYLFDEKNRMVDFFELE